MTLRRYESVGVPGPGAPLALECHGCGDAVSVWEDWNEHEWSPKQGRWNATRQFDLCRDCIAKVQALPPNGRFLPDAKQNRPAYRERALIAAFLRHVAEKEAPEIALALRGVAARIDEGDHRLPKNRIDGTAPLRARRSP